MIKKSINNKKLILVESPKKAKTIQGFLGDEYIVKASMGHIYDLAKGGKNGIGIDIKNNFRPHYVIIGDKVQVLDDIISSLDECGEIFILSDDDREGTAIAYHLKNALGTSGKKINRVPLKKISKQAIEAGINNPGDIDINLFKSQEARRILDRIIGFMVSPFLIEKHGAGLSAGRVQSVAARIIVDREKEIQAFKPEEYWNFFAKFTTNDGKIISTKLKNKIKTKEQVEIIKDKLSKCNNFFVKSVIATQKKQFAPPPLTTISLQKYMAQKHGFSPDRTMQAAQSLYETGYCSYIRTDSVRSAPEDIEAARDWLTKNNYEFPKKPNEYVNKGAAQDAHECIHPVNINDLPKNNTDITKDEAEVYKAIWLHFIASQMNPAIWDTVSIIISPKEDERIIFTTSGKTLKYKGYLELLNDSSDNENLLPKVDENSLVNIDRKSINDERKATQPPPRYTDVSLLKELENRQIGRPSTYAEIFKKITERNYIEKQGASYRPTELGVKIMNYLSSKFSFMEYAYSAEMEQKLDDIAAGTLDQKIMLGEFFTPFQKTLNEIYKEMGHGNCNKCGAYTIDKINRSNGNKFTYCVSCRNIDGKQEIRLNG